MTDSSYELYSLRKEKEFLQDKLQEAHTENDKWRSDYETLRQQAQISHNEYQTVKQNHDTAQKYVKMLEGELGVMK